MNKTKVKILYFIPGFYYGGIETFAVNMMERLDGNRFQVDLLKHDNNPDDTPLLNKVRSLGGTVYNLPPFQLPHLFSYIRATRSFLKEHSDYQVIHCHTLVHAFFLLYFAKRNHIPIRILHAHTTHWDDGWLRHVMGRIFRDLSLPLATHDLACSDLAATWGFGKQKYQTGKVAILHNGIELEHFAFSSQERERIRSQYALGDKIVIGHIGRLTTAKNGRFLLEILHQTLQLNPNVVLLQIGDGPDLPSLKIYAQELSVERQVLFLGKKEDAARYYSAFDIFLLPSLWEGAPVCAIEAQANGLPCLLSNVITREVNICGNIHYLSLDAPISQWAETLLAQATQRQNSTNAITKLSQAGYDSQTPVQLLEQLYTSHL